MKKKYLLLTFVLAATSSFAQNTTLDYKHALGINLQKNLNFNSKPFPTYPDNIQLSAFYQYTSPKRNTHEFMINGLSSDKFYRSYMFDNTTFYGMDKQFSFQTGYRYHVNLMKNKETKWNVSLGFGANTYSVFNNLEMNGENGSPRIFKSHGHSLSLAFEPTVSYHINSRMFLRFGLATNLLSFQFGQSSSSGGNMEAIKNSNFRVEIPTFHVQPKIGFAFKL